MKTELQFKAGKYYIGDPCYVFHDKEWSDVLSQTDYFSKAIKVKGKSYPVLGGSTAYGDGVYIGSDGLNYAVDSGMIAIIPFAACSKKEVYNHAVYGFIGHFITFKEAFEASQEFGIFKFGNLEIDTKDEHEDDES